MKRHCSLEYSGNIPALHLLPATSDWALKSSSCVWNCCCFCCPHFDKVSMIVRWTIFCAILPASSNADVSGARQHIKKHLWCSLQVFLVLSLKKIKIFISYTLWRQGNFSRRSPNVPCYPLVGQLEMGIQIRAAKKALIQNVAYGLWMLLEGTDRKFLEEGGIRFSLAFCCFSVENARGGGGGESPCLPLY